MDQSEENSDSFLLTTIGRQDDVLGRYFEKNRETFVDDLVKDARFYRPSQAEYSVTRELFRMNESGDKFTMEDAFQRAVQKRIIDQQIPHFQGIHQQQKSPQDAMTDICLYRVDDSDRRRFSVILEFKSGDRDDKSLPRKVTTGVCQALTYTQTLFNKENSAESQEFVSEVEFIF